MSGYLQAKERSKALGLLQQMNFTCRSFSCLMVCTAFYPAADCSSQTAVWSHCCSTGRVCTLGVAEGQNVRHFACLDSESASAQRVASLRPCKQLHCQNGILESVQQPSHPPPPLPKELRIIHGGTEAATAAPLSETTAAALDE